MESYKQLLKPEVVKKLRQRFPRQPYDLQMNIANKIYSALNIEKTKLMIVQSPTGTGKSYSLLVPILSWLEQNRFKLKSSSQADLKLSEQKKIPAFLLKKVAQVNCSSKSILQQKYKENLSKLVDIQQIAKSYNLKKKSLSKQKNQQVGKSNISQKNLFIEIDIQTSQIKGNMQNRKRNLSQQSRMIEQQQNLNNPKIGSKLIFISRTHSQLQQIIVSSQQIKPYLTQQLLSLNLGSKQHLCVNPQIKQTNNEDNKQIIESQSKCGDSVSEKCQYLLDHGKCCYKSQAKVKQFFNKNLIQTIDISQKYKICGYYALRNLVDIADILFLPYASLVNEQIRAKLGININNSIIVFDQGHNLMDLIKNSSTVEVFYKDLQAMTSKINSYIDKYGTKMKLQNKNILIHLNSILTAILDLMMKYHRQKFSQKIQYHKMTILELIVQLDLTEIKLHKIKKLFKLMDFDKKLAFFEPQLKLKSNIKNETTKASLSPFQIDTILLWIQNLYIESSTNRIVLIKASQQLHKNKQINPSIKLLCLHSQQLSKIIEQSRMTIVAGGTMEPLDQFKSIINKFSTQVVKEGHVISQQQCKIHIVKKYQQKEIRFNYQALKQNQSLNFLINSVKVTIQQVIRTTKLDQGIVVFIQSYRILNLIQQSLKETQLFKCLIFDVQSSSNTQSIFELYKSRLSLVSATYHSVLISVMGGKLSQGINFTDNLCRKLIIFGLPYSNIKSAQIIQQMKYYDQQKYEGFNGNIFYQNMCLRTINQTIGRAIRHKHDWAKFYLIDTRFQKIKGKLSEWMRKSTNILQNIQDILK